MISSINLRSGNDDMEIHLTHSELISNIIGGRLYCRCRIDCADSAIVCGEEDFSSILSPRNARSMSRTINSYFLVLSCTKLHCSFLSPPTHLSDSPIMATLVSLHPVNLLSLSSLVELIWLPQRFRNGRVLLHLLPEVVSRSTDMS